MGWKEARSAYANGSRLACESDESMVGRRMLKGLGLRSKDVWAAETEVFGDRSGDDPVFDRARRLVFAAAGTRIPVSGITVVPWLKSRPAMLDSVRERVLQMEPGRASAITARPGDEKRAVAWLPLPRHWQVADLPSAAALEFETPDFVVFRAEIEDVVAKYCREIRLCEN